ncbi:MAG: cytochrome P450 [Solirubrobacterales bacterium]
MRLQAPSPQPTLSEDGAELVRSAPSSPAGPIEPAQLAELPRPPAIGLPAAVQVLWFNMRQTDFVFNYRRKFGDVWTAHGYVRGEPAITCHPDHVRSLFTASPTLVPTLAAESPLRPVLGRSSVLTANEPSHMRQRKLLLPPFHGEAIARYEQLIADAAEREIATWPIGRPFSLAPKMQAVTLDVIMGGIFGIEGVPRPGTLEHGLRFAIRRLLWSSTLPMARVAELLNLGREEPVGLTRLGLLVPDRLVHAIIAKRRKAEDLDRRNDVLSLLLGASYEDGTGMSNSELRDELMTLVLAGHETTANQLAWAWERLLRSPAAHEQLLGAVRSDEGAAEQVEATILEAMRSRPVVPMTGRRVTAPWQLGPYGVPADTAVAISILLVHHREDVYPDPFSFRPERWLGRKPGTYEWLPFGGGTRRCLGAALAMAEQRVVLRTMAAHLDLEADDPKPERPRHRNVTMIPARGGRVVLRSRR